MDRLYAVKALKHGAKEADLAVDLVNDLTVKEIDCHSVSGLDVTETDVEVNFDGAIFDFSFCCAEVSSVVKVVSYAVIITDYATNTVMETSHYFEVMQNAPPPYQLFGMLLANRMACEYTLSQQGD